MSLKPFYTHNVQMELSQSLSLKRRTQQILLILTDFILIFLAFVLARYVRFGVLDFTIVKLESFIAIFIILFVFNYIFALYEPLHWRSKLFSPPKLFLSLLLTLIFVTLGIYLLTVKVENLTGRGVLALSLTFYYLMGLFVRYFFEKISQRSIAKEKWVLICNSDHHDIFQKENQKNPLPGNFIWIPINEIEKNISILNEISLRQWTGIIVEGAVGDKLTQSLMTIRLSGQPVHSFQTFFEVYWQKLPVRTLNASWFTFSEGFSILQNNASIKMKRFLDIILSVVLLLVTFPLTLFFWMLIRLESSGSGFYSQMRVGEAGRVFKIWKLRSMTVNAEKAGAQWAKQNDARVTTIGKFIRKARIDELPQAINILKGDMSFIGPRPERPEFTDILKRKIPYYDLRHLLKPGLTGWAQVMYPYGANEEDAVEKLEYELYYIKNYTVWLDVVILVKTVSIVLFGKGR